MNEFDEIETTLSSENKLIEQLVEIGIGYDFAKKIADQEESRKKYASEQFDKIVKRPLPKKQNIEESMSQEEQDECFDANYISTFFGDGLNRD